jgi:hypothetical protein
MLMVPVLLGAIVPPVLVTEPIDRAGANRWCPLSIASAFPFETVPPDKRKIAELWKKFPFVSKRKVPPWTSVYTACIVEAACR